MLLEILELIIALEVGCVDQNSYTEILEWMKCQDNLI